MSRFVIFGSFSGLYKTWFAWLFLWLQNLVAFLRLILNSILAHRSSDQNLTVHQCPSKPAKRHLAPEQAQEAGDEIWSKR
jgi:hypothetical protein